MVASHTEKPLGFSKWLDRATPTTETLLLGKGQGLLMSPTQGQAVFIGATFAPAISKHPRAFLYGWLPLSDAQRHPFLANRSCLMFLVSIRWLPLSDAFGIIILL